MRRTKMTALIETHELTKRFGTFTAVKGVSLRVKAGEILALLGPNGAGKTTTIRMLASILQPTAGWARVAGYDTLQEPEKVRRAVGLLTEHHGLYTRMKAHEYLEFFGRVYGLSPDEIRRRAERLLERYGLREATDQRLGTFSKGMRQKLVLVRALLHDPRVLLLDEPTSAMDPASAHLVRNSIAALRQSDRAIVVCTHNLHEAESLADRIAIIRRGEIIVQDTVAGLKRALLGDPIMELRVRGQLDGALQAVPQGVEILDMGLDWMRFRVTDPEAQNARLLEAFIHSGVQVVTLSEVQRSLEDAYLQAVGQEASA